MSQITETLGKHILAVEHVGFVVTDIEAAVANTCRLYGIDSDTVRWQPAPNEPAATRFAFLSVANLQFEFIQPCKEPFVSLLNAQPSGGGGINHIAWRVDDLDVCLALLAQRGVVPGYVTPGGPVAIGQRRMVYLDPATTDGLLVELMQP